MNDATQSSMRWGWFGLAALGLCLLFLSTLQTIPNGSSHYFMIDVGETQIVLNNWGTLHATGYPLYVILGNILTALLRLADVAAVTAPALVSLLWGMIALVMIFALIDHLTGRPWLAAGVILIFALTRSVWIHFVIAEIYSFGLMIVAGLLCLGLWRSEIKGRLYWMALLGGIGVAHHRATAMIIPALLVAVWANLITQRHRLVRLLPLMLLLGLAGFSQYAYLYLRGQSVSKWVYGEPGTLSGLWDQFIGKEANRFIGPAESADALRSNFDLINRVLLTDLTLPGILLGVAGLLLALRVIRLRRAALSILLLGLVSYVFHVIFYRDVLSALVLQITLSLALGWAMLLDCLLEWQRNIMDRHPEPLGRVSIAGDTLAHPAAFPHPILRWVPIGRWGKGRGWGSNWATNITILFIILSCAYLFQHNRPFIRGLVTDTTGQETIALVETAPAGSTVMLAWGPRYFAAGFAQDIRGELQHITLVDHKADFQKIIAEGTLITPDYTRFNQSSEWWEVRLGMPVYPTSSTPGLVTISTEPKIVPGAPDDVTVALEHLTCTDTGLILNLIWWAGAVPEIDYSVFVHALRGESLVPLAQADSFAPVAGWRPLTGWLPDEQIADSYRIAVDPQQVDRVRFGLYHSVGDNQFENILEREIMVECGSEPA